MAVAEVLSNIGSTSSVLLDGQPGSLTLFSAYGGEKTLEGGKALELEDKLSSKEDTMLVLSPLFSDIKDPLLSSAPTMRAVYESACRKLKTTPLRSVLRCVSSRWVHLNKMALGPKGTKALVLALKNNKMIKELHLSGNTIGAEEMKYVAELIYSSQVMTLLDLSDNNLESQGAEIIAKVLVCNGTLTSVNLSGNYFKGRDALLFAEVISETINLRELDLSYNGLHDTYCCALGQAIAQNKTLESLSLRWNHIRLGPALAIAESLKENKMLRQLDVSWNGFSNEGAKVFGEVLKVNQTLWNLDLCGNRITLKGVVYLFSGIVRNTGLKTLKLSSNPITNSGACMALEILKCRPDWSLETLDIEDVHVSERFESLLKTIHGFKPRFIVKHGIRLRGDGLSSTMYKQTDPFVADPLTLLINYIKEKNLRLKDLFSRFDQDGNSSVSKDELRKGIVATGIPLTVHQTTKLIDDLDRDNNGEIDFGELIAGQTAYRQRRRKLKGKKRHSVQPSGSSLISSPSISRNQNNESTGVRNPQSPLQGNAGLDSSTSRELLKTPLSYRRSPHSSAGSVVTSGTSSEVVNEERLDQNHHLMPYAERKINY